MATLKTKSFETRKIPVEKKITVNRTELRARFNADEIAAILKPYVEDALGFPLPKGSTITFDAEIDYRYEELEGFELTVVLADENPRIAELTSDETDVS